VDGPGALHRRLGVKRGDIVIVAPPGEFSKPRPALIVQGDLALPSATITYLMISSSLEHEPSVRIPIEPTPQNGLLKPSEIMVDLIQTSTRSRFRAVVGHIDAATMRSVDNALLIFLGLI
jgi:mRNA interferase MazF